MNYIQAVKQYTKTPTDEKLRELSEELVKEIYEIIHKDSIDRQL